MAPRRCGLALGAALVAVLLALPFVPRTPAFAHPLGNFTINRYARIELYRDRIQLHYVLDYAEIPSYQLAQGADTNHDGTLSPEELDAWAAGSERPLASSFDLTVNGHRLDLSAIGRKAQLLPGQGGLDTTRLEIVYDAPISDSGAVTVGFSDRNFADRAGWKEIVVRPSAGAEARVPAEFLNDQSAALTSYPAESLSSAPDQRSMTFSWTAGTGEAAPVTAAIAAGKARDNSGFTSLLSYKGSVLTLALLLFAAFAFGAQHALGPGHGKTVVAAYLVGSRGTARHAVVLGLTVTATHTSTVYLIGFITLAAAELISPERLYLYLGVASGLSIFGMGLLLFVTRLRTARRGAGSREDGAHRHGLFGPVHSHAPAPAPAMVAAGANGAPAFTLEARLIDGHHHAEHGHEPAHAQPHSHAGGGGGDAGTVGGHGHDHGQHGDEAAVADISSATAEPAAGGRVSWRSLVTLGVIGGLLPCPSAIIVMLAAISRGQVLFGMLLIVAFSLGLAVVLTAIGLALVFGRRYSGRTERLVARPLVARAIRMMPVFSAAVIAVVGFVLTYQAFQRPGL